MQELRGYAYPALLHFLTHSLLLLTSIGLFPDLKRGHSRLGGGLKSSCWGRRLQFVNYHSDFSTTVDQSLVLFTIKVEGNVVGLWQRGAVVHYSRVRPLYPADTIPWEIPMAIQHAVQWIIYFRLADIFCGITRHYRE